MGKGVRSIQIEFQNPIVVTQRFDELLLGVDNFTHPKKARDDLYPDASFGYSQVLPMVLNFDRPLQLYSMWLKQHRAPNFYLKNSVGNFNVSAYL